MGKVLITGATGFIGSHLCEGLQAAGHSVFALCRDARKLEQLPPLGRPIYGSMSCAADTPNDWLDSLPRELDAVVHVAGLVTSFRDGDFHRVNAVGASRLIQDLRGRYPRLRFVLASSLAAAGPSVEGLTEDDPLRPISAYGRSKRDAELLLRQLAPAGWETVCVRPPMVLGPRDPGGADLFRMVLSRFVAVPGMLGWWKPLSYVSARDVVRMLVRCLEADLPARRRAYFSGREDTVTFGQVTNAIADRLGIGWRLNYPVSALLTMPVARIFQGISMLGLKPPVFTPDKAREAGQPGWVCRSDRAVKELGMTAIKTSNLSESISVAGETSSTSYCFLSSETICQPPVPLITLASVFKMPTVYRSSFATVWIERVSSYSMGKPFPKNGMTTLS